jgi:glyoxylase-like metal-dependent hydrolase (beta-lactamase superfamily II)
MSLRPALFVVSGVLAAALLTVNVQSQTAGPAPGEGLSESYRGSQSGNIEYQKVAPLKVFDNLYYVGPGSVSAWLISTSDGLILIDAAQEPLVDHVIDSIRKVGFDPADIKYILISHGHLDHFGGVGKIQALSRRDTRGGLGTHLGDHGGAGAAEPSARRAVLARHGARGWPDPDAR